MKKLILFCLIYVSYNSLNAQIILLENTYPEGTIEYAPFNKVQLQQGGTKYVALNRIDRKLFLYNLDHTLYKEILLTLNDDWDGVMYISDGLFDDDAEIEYMVGANDYSFIKVYNEDGSIVWEETDCSIGCAVLWPQGGGDIDYGPIVNTDNGTKMMVHTNLSNSSSVPQSIIKIYGLPGSLILHSTGLEVYDNQIPTEFKIYPNPSGNSATVEYSLPKGEQEGQIVIYNITGQEVKRLNVESTGSPSGKIEIDNSQLQAGTYMYQLITSKGAVGTKKMVVVK